MGMIDKSGQPTQKPEQSPEEQFATRRKILRGLTGAPIFLTFGQRVVAADSFGHCILYSSAGDELDPEHLYLADYYTDGNGKIYRAVDADNFCQDLAFESTTNCLFSFFAQDGTRLGTCNLPPENPD